MKPATWSATIAARAIAAGLLSGRVLATILVLPAVVTRKRATTSSTARTPRKSSTPSTHPNVWPFPTFKGEAYRRPTPNMNDVEDAPW